MITQALCPDRKFQRFAHSYFWNLWFSGEANDGENIAAIFDDNEELYQQLWQQYFSSVNIAPRKNTKLHIQHTP